MLGITDIELALLKLIDDLGTKVPNVIRDVRAHLASIARRTESELWERAGDELFESAKAAQSDDETSYYVLFACVFRGHAVDLSKREAQDK